ANRVRRVTRRWHAEMAAWPGPVAGPGTGPAVRTVTARARAARNAARADGLAGPPPRLGRPARCAARGRAWRPRGPRWRAPPGRRRWVDPPPRAGAPPPSRGGR